MPNPLGRDPPQSIPELTASGQGGRGEAAMSPSDCDENQSIMGLEGKAELSQAWRETGFTLWRIKNMGRGLGVPRKVEVFLVAKQRGRRKGFGEVSSLPGSRGSSKLQPVLSPARPPCWHPISTAISAQTQTWPRNFPGGMLCPSLQMGVACHICWPLAGACLPIGGFHLLVPTLGTHLTSGSRQGSASSPEASSMLQLW